MIRFDQVTKRFGDGTVAVDQLDLVAASGRVTVLLGPSGCGKTTSLRMINRLVEPTSGRIWLDGQDTASLPATTLRRRIGYVIQDAGLFPHRTVADNVATVPMLLGRSRRQARQDALGLLERVGLDPRLGRRYPAQLSGGQQQRVGVARALAADPPVLLMDEPFSAVDPVVRTQLQDELLRLQAELGKTVMFVTHDLDEAVKLGDRVAVLRTGGRLAQVAPPAELLSHPADDFVAGFIGRDRGYRALGFLPATYLNPSPEPTVPLGAPLSAVRGLTPDGWTLVVDDRQRPRGWLRLPQGTATDTATDTDRVITAGLLQLGGMLAVQGGSLREALDAALSSPSGRGVMVDDDGRLLGVVTAAQVLAGLGPATAGTTTATDTATGPLGDCVTGPLGDPVGGAAPALSPAPAGR
jgi:osmoprotectant transport system ATP-binding protein